MKSNTWTRIGTLSLITFLALSLQVFSQNIVTFEAPGADTNPGDNNGTYPGGINNAGVITGSYQDKKDVFHGFLRSPDGTFTTFQVPHANTSPFFGTFVNAINDLGVITGTYYDENQVEHGFVGSPGKFSSFDVPGAANGLYPFAINLEGAIVGWSFDSNGLFHSFVRSPDGAVSVFLIPGQCETNTAQGCYGSELTTINLFGLSVGNYMDNDFVSHSLIRNLDGTFTKFDDPNAGTGQYQGTGCPGCALGFNQWGAIAGPYIDENYVQHGFVRSPDGTFTTFDAPGAGTGEGQGTGCPSDCPTSLNDFGAITGNYIDTNYQLHGYLRTPDGNVVSFDPTGSTYTWSSGINDFGVITGYYIDGNGVYHGFLRIP